jgi:hypothetical protein
VRRTWPIVSSSRTGTMSKRAHGAEALAHPCPVITSPMMRRTAPVEATRFVEQLPHTPPPHPFFSFLIAPAVPADFCDGATYTRPNPRKIPPGQTVARRSGGRAVLP